MQIFFHPWMTRWLCDFDRSRFHLAERGNAAFRFMPPLPPLAPPSAPYPPSAWRPEKDQQQGRTPGRASPSDLAVDPNIGTHGGPAEGAEETPKERSTAGTVELRADAPDSPGVAVGAMLPGFVKTSEPIPPFHLPLLLPLQLHLLLSVHLLLLSLRESQSSFLLAQKLQKELWSLQRCVHTAVGFFEVTATSAIETVIDIVAVFDGGDSAGDSSSAMAAVGELFGQVRRWTCEMQKQGERLGMRYERAEASVSDLICCVVAAVTSPVSNPQRPESQQQPHDVLPSNEVTAAVGTARIDGKGEAVPQEQQQRASDTSSDERSPEGHKRALAPPVPASHEMGATTDLGFSENGIGVWGSSGSVARMGVLREFLASNLRRMLYSCAQPPGEGPPREGASCVGDDRQQIDAGVQVWSQVGMPDPSAVTEEILDFLFLSTKTAASHARQMTQPSEKPGECFSVGAPDSASRFPSTGNPSCSQHDVPNPRTEPNHCESAPERSKAHEYASESPSSGGDGLEDPGQWGEDAKRRNNPQCAELSFLCESGSPASSSNMALQDKIATSRLQLRSLEKLRQVSYILTCVCSFWSNFDVILCRLLQLQQITETLTKHSRASWINKRAHKRLGHLKDCWVKFRTQCRIYLQLSNARNAKLMDLGLHVQMRADELDAIRALRGIPEE